MRSILTRSDKILIAAIVLLAVMSAVPVVTAALRSSPGTRALVTVAGRRVAVLPLNAPGAIEIRTRVGAETLEVASGKIRVVDAPCPRGVCRHTGWISRGGQELVCVPGQMIVRIEGGERAGVDAVSR